MQRRTPIKWRPGASILQVEEHKSCSWSAGMRQERYHKLPIGQRQTAQRRTTWKDEVTKAEDQVKNDLRQPIAAAHLVPAVAAAALRRRARSGGDCVQGEWCNRRGATRELFASQLIAALRVSNKRSERFLRATRAWTLQLWMDTSNGRRSLEREEMCGYFESGVWPEGSPAWLPPRRTARGASRAQSGPPRTASGS